MKNRSENCWLMQSRMVAAVATTSAQRQAPRSVRTRVTSASCMLAWGSSNSILFEAAAATLSDTDISIPRRVAPAHPLALDHSKPFGMLALASAAARAFIQPSAKAFSSEGGLPLL